MNNRVLNLLAFIAGAGIGSFVTYKALKSKFEQRAQEEIDSVKEVYSRKYTSIDSEPEDTDAAEEEPDQEPINNYTAARKESILDYAARVNVLGYSNKVTDEDEDEEDEEDMVEYEVIAPEEFGDDPNYECVSFTYFSDGVLVDEDMEVVEDHDIEYCFGLDFASHFGEYEDDSVFIRHDGNKGYYEILKDVRNYADVIKNC